MGLRAAARAAAQSFDRTAAGYDRLGDLGQNDSIRSWLVSVLPPAGGRALDLGCGAGRDSVLLAERFAHVDAVDLSLPMIEIARAKRSRPNIAYRQADLLEVTGSGEYDLVLSVMTLHRPARPGRRLGGLPAVHRQGVARSPCERPVLQPRGARPVLRHPVSRLPAGAA